MRHQRWGLRSRCPAECAAAWLLLLAAVSAGQPSPPSPGAAVKLRLSGVAHSNLGGAGPDAGARGLRYRIVAVVSGKPVDLVVTVQDSEKKYSASSPERNGLQHRLGRINLQAGSGVNLILKFVEHRSTRPVKLDHFFFTVYDIDQSIDGKLQEKVMVGGYDKYCLSPRAELDYAGTSSGGVRGVSLTSTEKEVPDPSIPEAPGPVQENHATSFYFTDASEFPVRLEVLGPANASEGRDFLFSLSPLSCFLDSAALVRRPSASARAGGQAASKTEVKATAAVNVTSIPAATGASTTTRDPFDCSSRYSTYDFMWFKAKRDWCCQHRQTGCPTTTSTTSSSTSSTLTTSTTTSSTATSTTATTTTTSSRTTSTSTITITSTSSTSTRTRSTTLASSSTSQTGMAASDTSTWTSATDASYDCTLEKNWMAGWSPSKKDWCCTSQGIACMADGSGIDTSTTSSIVVAPIINGEAGAGQVERYDCTDGYLHALEWPERKRAWCCASVGWPSWGQWGCKAPSQPYDCGAGFSNWQAGWSAGKKTWCCKSEKKGCGPVAEPYDCAAGYLNWQAGWSSRKKRWCCENKEVGCQPDASAPDDFQEFDCNAHYLTWDTDWSEDKKVWCCRAVGWGCHEAAGPAAAARAALESKFEPQRRGLAGSRQLTEGSPTLLAGCLLASVLFIGSVCAVRASRVHEQAYRGGYVSVPEDASLGRMRSFDGISASSPQGWLLEEAVGPPE